MTRIIKYNLQYTLISILSENLEIIPKIIQDDIRLRPKGTIINKEDLKSLMKMYLELSNIEAYEIYKGFIDDSHGNIFILID